MSDGPENLTLRYLRAIDEKLDRALEELGDLKIRTTSVEQALAGVNRRLDRADARLDRIERRLNLVDAS